MKKREQIPRQLFSSTFYILDSKYHTLKNLPVMERKGPNSHRFKEIGTPTGLVGSKLSDLEHMRISMFILLSEQTIEGVHDET